MQNSRRWVGIGLGLTVLIQFLLVAVHFLDYPLFPQNVSGIDFIQYVRIVDSYAAGNYGTPTANILYGGVFFYLTAWVRLLPFLAPEVLTQYAMGALVVGSPLFVFFAGSGVFRSKKAGLVSALLWTLSASVWYGMVFDSGLYANFFGVIASLFYIGAALAFFEPKKAGVKREILFAVAIGLAYFSHYTTLYVLALFPIFLFLRGRSERKTGRALTVALATYLPALIAILVFPSLLSILGQFASGSGSPVLAGEGFPTYLASVIPIVSLKNMVDIINDDWLALFMLGCLIPFTISTVKKRDWLSAFLLAWFLAALAAAPLNATNWRSAFMALVPLGFIASKEVAGLWREGWNFSMSTSTKRSWKVSDRGHPGLKAAALMVILVFPVFVQSWGFQTVSQQGVSSSQQADYLAMRWMAAHQNCSYVTGTVRQVVGLNESHEAGRKGSVESYHYNATFYSTTPDVCGYIAVSDPYFSYYQVMGGQSIAYLADHAGISWADPAQVSFYAARQNLQLLIVTQWTDLAPPEQSYTTLTASTPAQLEAEVLQAQVSFHGYGELSFTTPGVTSTGAYSTSVSIVLEPWATYNQTSLQVALPPLYNESGVTIWCLDTAECGKYA